MHRQLSVSSDSKLLDDDIREETRVIMRPKKPPRPKSEVFLNKHNDPHPRRKRFSAFGVSEPFGILIEIQLLELINLMKGFLNVIYIANSKFLQKTFWENCKLSWGVFHKGRIGFG